jgi:thioredoxin 1
MKFNLVFFLSFFMVSIVPSNVLKAQTSKNPWTLPASVFSTKIKQNPTSSLLDVRTPGEFTEGHLKHAKNLDWNGDGFMKGISTLNKSKPVYVYCLSGGRSAAAAKAMREVGFKEVFELQGGVNNWKNADLPLEK